MKKWQKIAAIVVVALFALGVIKNVLIKGAITTVGSAILGAKIEVKHFSLGIITQKVHIKGLKVQNPKGFLKDEPMVDIPEIRVDFNSFAFLRGKLHLPLVIVNLKQMTLIRNKEGVLNVDSLKIVQDSKKEEAKAKEERKKITKKKAKSKSMPFQIDLMKLNIEQVVYKDFSAGEPPVILAYDLNLKDKEFRDINNPAQLAMIILVSGMQGTAIKSAGIYSAATILGATFLPMGAAMMAFADDDSEVIFKQSIDKVYDTSLKVIANSGGSVSKEDRTKGFIKAKIYGTDVTFEVRKGESKGTSLKISARKMMIPKPDVAGGVLYQVKKILN